jgi:hypothetical protein
MPRPCASKCGSPSDPLPELSSRVDLVGVLFIVWGILTALVGVSTLLLAIAAASIVSSAGHSGNLFTFTVTAAFLTLGVIAIIWGVAHVAVGVPLRQHRPAARLLALTFGAVDLVLLPYGTALGCYTLWVLLNEQGKKLFA